MPTVCHILEKFEGRINSIDQRLAAIGVTDSSGRGRLQGSLWEVSEDQIAVWSSGTTRPLGWSQGQWARLRAGRIEARGDAFEFMSSDTGARIVFNGSQFAGYSDATTKEFYLDAATGKAYFAGGKAILSKDGIILSDELLIKWESTATVAADIYAVDILLEADPPSASSTAFWGIRAGAASNPTCSQSLLALYGSFGYGAHKGSGTLETIVGMYGSARVYSGAGAVTEAYGAYTYIINESGCNITTAFLWRGSVLNNGTIGTMYGFYLPTLSGNTTWGIYQAGSGDQNYFAGHVQVGGFKMASGAVNGYVLVSDGAGEGTWQSTAGIGDMLKSVYDPNDDGVIANAQVADDITLTNITQITNRAHSDLSGVTADLHHAQAHVLATTGPHTGNLPWADLNKSGSDLADLATKAHASLTEVSANQHHAQSHALTAHTGDVAWSQIDSLVAVGQLRDANRIMAKSIASPVTNKYLKYNGTSMVWDTGGALPSVAGVGYALISDGVNSWAADQTPTWTGKHTLFGEDGSYPALCLANYVSSATQNPLVSLVRKGYNSPSAQKFTTALYIRTEGADWGNNLLGYGACIETIITGDSHGGHSSLAAWMFMNGANTHGSYLWTGTGVWAAANSPTSNVTRYDVQGLEANIGEVYADRGHIASQSTPQVTCGISIVPDAIFSGTEYHVTFGMKLVDAAGTKFHTGISIEPNAIVPYHVSNNPRAEGIWLRGGSSDANKWSDGLRISGHHLRGIDFEGGTFTGAYINFASGDYLQFASDNWDWYVGSALIFRIHGGGRLILRGDRIIDFDANDYISYASDRYLFHIGGVCRFYIDTTGGHDGAP